VSAGRPPARPAAVAPALPPAVLQATYASDRVYHALPKRQNFCFIVHAINSSLVSTHSRSAIWATPTVMSQSTDGFEGVSGDYEHSESHWITTAALSNGLCYVGSRWRGDRTGRALDLRSTGVGFKSYSGAKLCNNLGQGHPCASVTKQYNLVPAKGR